MLNFTVDKTKTMYAAFHTHTDTASGKHKTPHSTTVYLQKSWKLYQLFLYILFRMPPSSFRLGLLRRFLLRRACSTPSTQTFLTEEQVKWSSSTATTLLVQFFYQEKTQTPHLSSLSSLNFRLILLRTHAHQICIYQQSLSMFPMMKRDGV